MIDPRVFSTCMRAATFHTPLIKRHLTKAAHGPKASAKHQFDQAIDHARRLLDELQTQAVALGWREPDGGANG